MKSLRTRLTITIVLVVFGSSILLSFISYQRARTSLINQMEDNYAVAAQKYALELTSWVSTNATIIDTLAAEIAVNEISTKDYDTFHNYLKNSNELLNKNGYVYDVYFTYPNNTMVCASDFIADGSVDFVHEREWYTTSALTGELFYAAPYLDSDTHKPIITISKAVYSKGELLGVLAADIFVDVLVDMVREADVEENSYAFLADQNMRMLVHPNPAYDYDDVPLGIMDVPDAPYGELVSYIQNGYDEMAFVKDYDGVTRGVAVAQMPNTGWYVCIATDKAALAKGVGALVRGFVVATLVSILVGAVIAIFLARVLDKLSRQEQEYRQEVLRLEKQAADEASAAKSRFLADMSHEIRTPINAIIGMNEMILRESDSSDILGYSENIRQSGRNLLQLINGILDFSKIEDGKMEIIPVRYSVATQIAYLLNSVSERASAKGLELNFNVDPKLPSELFGDDTRINQVIVNLLTNAVKYTEKGSVTFTMEGRNRNPEDGTIVIFVEVKDTGIGIKDSDLPKLFESFERLDVVRNRHIEGTGLGMAIVTRLLELMGGELKVESKYGEGSAFSFELLQKIENDEPLGDYRAAIADIGDSPTYKEIFRAPDAHILVVDDTRMNIIVVESLLKTTGVKIDSALCGADSIELSRENHYDLILMDQRMPGMDGTEAMKEIRELEENKDTPIICLTADVIRGAKEKYVSLGFDDYLTKPIEGDELEKMLLSYLPPEKVEITETMSSAGTTGMTGTTGMSGPAGMTEAIGTSGKFHELEELFKALEEIGVDTEAGIEFCAQDEHVYMTVLEAYVAEEKTKSQDIRECFIARDWENYGIYIHSLKSTSKTVGALELYKLAAELETAARSGDEATVMGMHDEVLDKYEKLVAAISDHIDMDAIDSLDESGILEFAPHEGTS